MEASEAKELVIESDRFPGRHTLSSAEPRIAPIVDVVKRICIENHLRPNFHLRITSAIPDGSGLGSSASTMVSVACALGKLNGLELSTRDIIRYGMIGEKGVHGRPSGIDVETCARGGVILYKMGVIPKRVRFSGKRSFLIIQSGRRRSTRRLIAKVSSLKGRYPNLFSALGESASLVSRLAAERLVEGDMQSLGKLLTYNHAVLSAVGASDAGLDALVDLALSFGCYGAKLTGAGGGGSVLAIPRRGHESVLKNALEKRGFESFEAVLPTHGVESWLQ